MEIYIAWWDWSDGWEHSEGVLGMYDKEDAAVAVAKAYAESQNDSYSGSRVTCATLNEKSGGYFDNVLHSFESVEKTYEEEEDGIDELCSEDD